MTARPSMDQERLEALGEDCRPRSGGGTNLRIEETRALVSLMPQSALPSNVPYLTYPYLRRLRPRFAPPSIGCVRLAPTKTIASPVIIDNRIQFCDREWDCD